MEAKLLAVGVSKGSVSLSEHWSVQIPNRWQVPIDVFNFDCTTNQVRIRFPILLESFAIEKDIRLSLGSYWKSSWVDGFYVVMETEFFDPQEVIDLLYQSQVVT